MATFTLFNNFKSLLGKKVIDLTTDSFKAMLSDTAPNVSTMTVKADVTEIAAGNGYTAGGQALTSVTWAETGAGTGIFQFTAADISWTASGGNIATHRYLYVYDDTVASPVKPLVGYVDRGSSAVITSGNTRLWDIGSTGLLQLA